MTDEKRDTIEEHIGLTQPDAFEVTTGDDSVTTRHIFADGGDGKEKEATLHSPRAGASSDAPSASGIPSAMTQNGVFEDTPDATTTSMGDRDIPTHQDTKP